jgi:Flp pilus assembly protein TadD
MPRKIKQYKNPFLRSNFPLVVPVASALPNLLDAISLHQQGQLVQAEASYRQHLEIDPSNADALHLLGVIAYQTGHYQDAVELISKAIRHASDIASYHSNLGNVLQELKQFDSAVVCYDKAIQLNPKDIKSLKYKGNCFDGSEYWGLWKG